MNKKQNIRNEQALYKYQNMQIILQHQFNCVKYIEKMLPKIPYNYKLYLIQSKCKNLINK